MPPRPQVRLIVLQSRADVMLCMPKYDPTQRRTMNFDMRSEVVDDLLAAQLTRWNK
jgi:hypothetical protein